MTLYLTRSRPKSTFKNLMGNANHLIITALVGLDAVERNIVQEVPKELRAAWSPKDSVASAKRSRRLILDMALIRSIDSVDIYLRDAVRKPAIIQSANCRKDLDSAGLSIFRKLQVVERYCAGLDRLPLAIIFLMVAWRNRSAHSESDLDAPQQHLDILRSRAKEIEDRFRNLDAQMLLDGYNLARPITFKEVASLINAAQHLVTELDSWFLGSLDIERYLKDLIWVKLGDSKKPNELIDNTRRRRAASVWGNDPSDRSNSVLRFLVQQGFSTVRPKEGCSVQLPAELFSTLCEQTPKSILIWALPSV